MSWVEQGRVAGTQKLSSLRRKCEQIREGQGPPLRRCWVSDETLKSICLNRVGEERIRGEIGHSQDETLFDPSLGSINSDSQSIVGATVCIKYNYECYGHNLNLF